MATVPTRTGTPFSAFLMNQGSGSARRKGTCLLINKSEEFRLKEAERTCLLEGLGASQRHPWQRSSRDTGCRGASRSSCAAGRLRPAHPAGSWGLGAEHLATPFLTGR